MSWSVGGESLSDRGLQTEFPKGGFSLLCSWLRGMLVLTPCVFLGGRLLDPPGPHAQGPLCASLCASVSTSEARPLPLQHS